MASSSTDEVEAGFATPAAAIISLAIATVVTATLLLSVGQLRASRANFLRTQIEYALDGAQSSAVMTVRNAQAERLAWRIDSPAGPIDMLAEPEWLKVGLGSPTDALSSTQLMQLGVARPSALQLALQALPTRASGDAVRDLDSSTAWKRCARSLVSPWSASKGLALYKAVPPAPIRGNSPTGQTWRIVASLAGWVDDRTEIITGNPNHPAIPRERRYERLTKGPITCDDLFAPRPTTSAETPATP